MRYIQFLNKQDNKKKEIQKPISITNIAWFQEGNKIKLKIIGESLPENQEYQWVIKIDDFSITSTSHSLELILSKKNSLKFLNASNISIIISVDNYTSDEIIIL